MSYVGRVPPADPPERRASICAWRHMTIGLVLVRLYWILAAGKQTTLQQFYRSE